MWTDLYIWSLQPSNFVPLNHFPVLKCGIERSVMCVEGLGALTQYKVVELYFYFTASMGNNSKQNDPMTAWHS